MGVSGVALIGRSAAQSRPGKGPVAARLSYRFGHDQFSARFSLAQVAVAANATELHPVFAAINIGIGGSFIFGTAAGELIRPLVLPLLNPQVRRTTAFLTIIVERIFDLSVLCMLFASAFVVSIHRLPTFRQGPRERDRSGPARSASLALSTLLLFRGRLSIDPIGFSN